MSLAGGVRPLVGNTVPPAAGAQVRLKLRDAAGRVRWEECPLDQRVSAECRASARGQSVLAVELIDPDAAATRKDRRTFNLMLFAQELKSLLEAGLNLPEAISVLLAKERGQKARAILEVLRTGIDEGRSFSEVLIEQSAHFPEIFAATVRGAERTGDLPRALSRFVGFQLQMDELKKKLTAAAIYPSALLAFGSLVMLFLMGYVVPRFSAVYESSGKELPGMSAMLLGFGGSVRSYWEVYALSSFCVAVAITALLGQRTVRSRLAELLLGLPRIEPRVSAFRIARFYRALALLLNAGIPLPAAMGMVREMLGHALSDSYKRARLAVEQGLPLSSALVSAGLAAPASESLIRVGERSGRLAEMLERAAGFSDAELSRWLDVTSRLLEPALMLLIGLLVGTVVVLMYLPIFDLASSL